MDFIRAVARMRRLQRRYFAARRTAADLAEARDAERRIDAALRLILADDPPGLFDAADGGAR